MKIRVEVVWENEGTEQRNGDRAIATCNGNAGVESGREQGDVGGRAGHSGRPASGRGSGAAAPVPELRREV